MRRFAGAAGVAGMVAAFGLLSACTPPDVPLAAVWLDEDRRPVAEIRPCHSQHATDVHLGSWTQEEQDALEESPDAGSSGTVASDGVDSGWAAWTVWVASGTSFRLFPPPPSWRVQTFGRQELLPGRTYALSFGGGGKGNDDRNGHVYFTTADLASLRPGQVWADNRAMSREDFDKLVDHNC